MDSNGISREAYIGQSLVHCSDCMLHACANRAMTCVGASANESLKVQSPIIRACLESIPDIRGEIETLLSKIDAKAAVAANKLALFRASDYPEIAEKQTVCTTSTTT
jgi:hypothetical protein